MKYVIIKVGGATEYVYPFIFSEKLSHSETARWVQRAVEREFKRPGEVYSAGFCHVYNNEWQTEHGSESLRIERNDRQGYKDHRILNQPDAMQNMLTV